MATQWLTLDDPSRCVIAWKHCATMRAADVTDTLALALDASGCDGPTVLHRPRPLGDNGSSCIAGDLATWLEAKRMEHVRGAQNHPQLRHVATIGPRPMADGKIERWHQTLKNRILLESRYMPGALEAAIGDFADQFGHWRVHESFGNVTP